MKNFACLFLEFFTRFKSVADQRLPPRPMLSPMDGNIPHSTPPSTPPSKRRRVDATGTTGFPPFDEEPHASPSKLAELGIHVLLSPKNQHPRNELGTDVARLLSFAEGSSDAKHKVKSEDDLEYWDRPRESMYVTAFNTAVDTVIEREGHLFSQEEMSTINLYRNLPCTPFSMNNANLQMKACSYMSGSSSARNHNGFASTN